MFVAVDIGNTETVMGWFEGSLDPVQVWRVATNRRTGDEVELQLRGLLGAAGLSSPQRIVVASVVPALGRSWQSAARNLGVPLRFLDGASPVPVRLQVDHPLGVGADRIANTLAATEVYARDAIVVDLGTATTFDCITADGVFLGGAIAPGPTTGAEQLTRAAAQLPQVEIEEPRRVIGTNTLDCLRSGAFYSVVDGIDGIVGRLAAEWGRAPLVVATGGLAEVVAPHCQAVDEINPTLTIAGVAAADPYLFPA